MRRRPSTPATRWSFASCCEDPARSHARCARSAFIGCCISCASWTWLVCMIWRAQLTMQPRLLAHPHRQVEARLDKSEERGEQHSRQLLRAASYLQQVGPWHATCARCQL